jgi:P-aminobenzoate N-oxygenase AurF
MQYQSPFADWYTCSTVHKQLPDFTCEPGLVLFPSELVPGVGHPLVDKLGDHAVRRLTMRKLESYNAFTEKLEYKAVMAASIKIAQNPRAFGLSEQAGREARLIVTDESHHAYVAIELIKQIPGYSELLPLTPSQPRFLRGLEELERGLPAELADDLLIAFVSISETLITSILRGIPRDPRVVSAVRNTVRDHCIDEARHHSYFVYVVHQHWASSTLDRREILGPLYAKLIRLFLDPDLDLCRAWLLEAGLDAHDAGLVLQDYYSPERVAASVRADSFPTLKLMERVGILDHPVARPAFVEQKLID